jgi:hypothetical protein
MFAISVGLGQYVKQLSVSIAPQTDRQTDRQSFFVSSNELMMSIGILKKEEKRAVRLPSAGENVKCLLSCCFSCGGRNLSRFLSSAAESLAYLLSFYTFTCCEALV